MTVVAEDDWITAVMAAPTSTPRKRLAVNRSRICFIRLPAAASRPELIICIPYKNRASPPNRLKKSVICISQFPPLSLLENTQDYCLSFLEKYEKRHRPRSAEPLRRSCLYLSDSIDQADPRQPGHRRFHGISTSLYSLSITSTDIIIGKQPPSVNRFYMELTFQ